VKFLGALKGNLMQIGNLERQSLISFVTSIGLTGIGYLATMYFAHFLGPAVLGSYFLFLAYYGIFDLIGDAGFGGAAVKRISEGKEPGEYFSAFIVLRVILLAFSLTILFFLAPYLVDLRSSGLLPWLVPALIVGTIAGIAIKGVHGTAKAGVAQISIFLNNLIKVIVQVIATFLGFTAAGLAGGFIVGMVAGLLVNYRYLEIPFRRFKRTHLKSLSSFSFWIFLASSGFLVFTYSDTIFIGYFLSDTEVGIYRVAYQLTSVAVLTVGSLQYVLYPQMSAWYTSGNIARVESALSRGFTYSLIFALPVVAGGLLLGDQLLYFLYGSAFESGTTALFILLLVQVASSFMYLQTMCLNAIDQPKKSFIGTAIAVVLNILLNIALIPLLGINGAAIATLGSITLNAVLSYTYLSRSMQVRLERSPVLHITASTLVMALAVILFRFAFGLGTVLHLAAVVIIGGVLYLLVLFRIDQGIKDDIRSIIEAVGIPWPALS